MNILYRKGKVMKSIYFKAIVILVITCYFPDSPGAQLRQTTPSEAMIKIPESSVRPRFSLVVPAKSRLRAGGTPVVATLQGNGLDRIKAVQILQNNSPVRDIEARLGPGGKTTRMLTFSARSNATPATYIIKGISTDDTGMLMFIQLEVMLASSREESQSHRALLEVDKTLKDMGKDQEIKAKQEKIKADVDKAVRDFRDASTAQIPVTQGPLKTPLLPDLAVSKVTFAPIIATTMDRIMIDVEIKNQGTAAVVIPLGKTVWLATRPNGGGVGPKSQGETIGPGLSFSRSLYLFNAGELKPGTYQIRVTVDPENSVRESQETNNQFLCSLTVFDASWRILYQDAIARSRELPATGIEAELRSSEATMIAAEQLLNRKPISSQAAQSIIQELSARIKKLENLMEETRQKRQEYQTMFENFDQKASQLFTILSTVVKNQKEMQMGITRNIN
jgi:hypothetical protein